MLKTVKLLGQTDVMCGGDGVRNAWELLLVLRSLRRYMRETEQCSTLCGDRGLGASYAN